MSLDSFMYGLASGNIVRPYCSFSFEKSILWTWKRWLVCQCQIWKQLKKIVCAIRAFIDFKLKLLYIWVKMYHSEFCCVFKNINRGQALTRHCFIMLWPGPSVFAQSMDKCWLTLVATPALLRPRQKGCRLLITFRGTFCVWLLWHCENFRPIDAWCDLTCVEDSIPYHISSLHPHFNYDSHNANLSVTWDKSVLRCSRP